MAVVVRVHNILLPDNVTHIATDYEVATDLLFNNIVLSSIRDEVNLTVKIYNDILDPTISYYSRTRCLLSTGYAYYSNVSKFTPKDVERIEFDVDMPSILGIPRVTTSGSLTQHPTTMFSVSVSGFTAVGTATHEYTTYIIETLDGNVLWKKEKSSLLTNIEINDLVLKANTVYRLNVLFHASSGDVSQVGTTTFKTGINKHVNVITNLNELDLDFNNEIRLVKKANVTYVEYHILHVKDGVITSILDRTITTSDMFTLPVLKGTLKLNNKYILKIKTSLDSVYYVNQFTTF